MTAMPMLLSPSAQQGMSVHVWFDWYALWWLSS